MSKYLTVSSSGAVYLRLVPFDTSAHVRVGFQESVTEFLRRSGLDPQWVDSGETLTILLHQPEQRLDPAPVIQAVCSLEATGVGLISVNRSCLMLWLFHRAESPSLPDVKPHERYLVT